MAQVGYVRVSSHEQNTVRQLDGVQLDKVFTDKASGATTERPELIAMLDYIREGDKVHVHSIDRLGRSLVDLKDLVKQMTDKGITVVFHKEHLEFSPENSSPINTLMFNMLASFAEFERALIRERQREGIEKAKQEGRYMGRTKSIDDEKIIEAMKEDGASFRKVAKKLGVSLSTVQRAMKKAQLET